MSRILLIWGFVGSCWAQRLEVPGAGVAVRPGDTTLLPATLHLPAPPPASFQLRWRFLPTGRLVLLVVAQGCGPAPWRLSCRLGLEPGRGYEGRAGLGPRDASLELRGACPEDAGPYRVSLLGLELHAAAELNLSLATDPATDPATVLPPITPAPPDAVEPQDNLEPPLAPAQARLEGGKAVGSNAVRLGLAGLVLCLLAVIVGKCRSTARPAAGSSTDRRRAVPNLGPRQARGLNAASFPTGSSG
ncbi:uncharacterized protein LOC142024647 isoform X2 [Carettochelys insculpta]|uniref:uncharacterized protein LOC142024647 isoform X2 n=1 Tax=Carettochelys insculpta TaxID=44489 RepID=UPI003EBCF702